MHERPDLTASPAAIRDAARAAASSDVLAARVAELEQQLASERAHNAGRIREIDSVMRVLRKSMQDLQDEIRRSSAERERLREQLEQTRRNLAAITTGTGPAPDSEPDAELLARIASLESDLSDARADADAARLERDDLRGRADELRQEIERRDASLAEVRGRLAEAEAVVAELRRARPAARPAATSAATPAAQSASSTPDDLFVADDDGDARADAVGEADADFIFDTCDPAAVEVPAPRAPRSAPQASIVVHGAPSIVASRAANYVASGVANGLANGVADVSDDDSVSVGLDDIEPLAPPAAPAPQVAQSIPAYAVAPPAGGPELLEDSRTGPIDGSPRATAPQAAPLQHASPRDSRAPAEIAQDPSFPEIPGHRLERLLEEGPLGAAYEAREVATRRPVLVRVLPGSLKLFDGKGLDSLLLAKHPNLVGVLSFAVSRAGPYLVLERADGESVDRWIQRVGPLPERIALAVTLECARGLRQAAFHGALHLDLAPESILVDAAGKVRVGGVGLRPVLAPSETGARSPAFAAPERLRDGAPCDVRADIYSLGAILFYLLTGRAPFAGSKDEIARLQVVGPPEVRETRPEITSDTSKLIARLLSADADLRHATWDQVLVDLERRVPGQSSPELRGNLQARVRRFAVLHPWVVPAAISTMLAIAIVTRIALSPDETAGDRFRIAKIRVQALAAKGDNEGARELLRPFLRNAGDPQIEREAARLFDELRPAPK